MTNWEKDNRRKKFYVLVPLMTLFLLLLYEQGALHFQFALGPANYVAETTSPRDARYRKTHLRYKVWVQRHLRNNLIQWFPNFFLAAEPIVQVKIQNEKHKNVNCFGSEGRKSRLWALSTWPLYSQKGDFLGGRGVPRISDPEEPLEVPRVPQISDPEGLTEVNQHA